MIKKNCILFLVELKFRIKTLINQYKDSDSKSHFFLIYFLSTILCLSYFSFFSLFFIFYSIIWLIIIPYKLYFLKKINVNDFTGYSFKFKSPSLSFLKYYIYMLPISYSFSTIYFILSLWYDKKYIYFLKTIISKFLYFLWIYVFGFSLFFLKINSKIYTRIENSFYKNKFSKNLFYRNIESMYFLDFSKTIKIEDLNIYIDRVTNKITFNPPKVEDILLKIKKFGKNFDDTYIGYSFSLANDEITNKLIVGEFINVKSHISVVLPLNKEKTIFLKKNITSQPKIKLNNETLINYTKYKNINEQSYETQMFKQTGNFDTVFKEKNLNLSENEIRYLIKKIIYPTLGGDILLLEKHDKYIEINETSKKTDIIVKSLKEKINLAQSIVEEEKLKGNILVSYIDDYLMINNSIEKELGEKNYQLFLDLVKFNKLSSQNILFLKKEIKEDIKEINLIKYNQITEKNKDLYENIIKKYHSEKENLELIIEKLKNI